MSKWIRLDKSPWGLSVAVVFFNKVCLYAGKTDHWGIGANISLYDRSLTLELLNLYTGIEVWRSKKGTDS